MVAYDVGEHSLFDVAFHAHEVVEAFVAFGVFGSLPAWQHDHELVGYAHGVDHLVLGIAGVDVAAYEGDFGHGGVEVLVLELADLASLSMV